MLISSSTHTLSTSHPIFSITHPERSPELEHLTEITRVHIPDIFQENISPQMGTLLGQLPAFESMISRNHRIFDAEIYHFLVSRGYEPNSTNTNEQNEYRKSVDEFIQKGNEIGAKIDTDVFVETGIVAGAPRGRTSFKYYQTFNEKSWKYCIEKLPELYGKIAREFSGKGDEKISAKFPAFLSGYKNGCDNLVIYCRNKENLQKIQKIVEEWIWQSSIPAQNRPFYRSAFGIDTAPNPEADKTSFSDLCAILASDYAKKYDEWYQKKTGKRLSTKEYNILALGQACMMASSDPKTLSTKTKR